MYLADLQQRMREAVVAGCGEQITPFLRGDSDVENRLAIHQRNYESSLVNALLGKFPGAAWLVGTPFLIERAQRFVRENPPHAPCVAEYGETFPAFLAQNMPEKDVPYLRPFAELEWHIGQVAIAVDYPVLTIDEFSTIDPSLLSEMTLSLQHGLRYMAAQWPIDELMKLYLTEMIPDDFQMEASNVSLEIHGSRGNFQINRLDSADFIFRSTIAAGATIGDAAESALDTNPAFDSGRSLVSLILSGFVTGENR